MGSNHSLQLARISSRLHELFDKKINLSDLSGKSADHQEGFFLTRSLAALALMDEADLTPDNAAASVTDGGADDGIDAVCIDDKQKIVYFVQSKWRSGSKGVQLSEFTRFRDGVKNVLALKWNSDNENLHPFRGKIEVALKDIDTNVVMLLVHTSAEKLAANIQSRIAEFRVEQNKYVSDFLEFKEIDLSQVAHAARSLTRVSDIDLSIMLRHFGRLEKPYEAVYGSVSGIEVVKWNEDHGQKLFAENLRYVIEKSDVNEAIMDTAEKDPGSFWYFNNGITAICDSIQKQPLGGTGTESGVFDVKKISVINGAQTIGSLTKAKASGASLDNVSVHLRIISLTSTPEGFSSSVTRSNNTQNDLNPADFVAFDPNQERIRKEALQIGVTYSFRRGEADPSPSSGFNIRSATVAAACASGDLKLAVSAKRYISGLWDDIKKEPYTKLFNDNTSAVYLWNIVRLMNAVDGNLEQRADKLSGRERLIAVHGNRFILFYAFEHIDLASLKEPISEFDKLKATCIKLSNACLDKITPKINLMFPDSYPGNIFKNQDRQSELLKSISGV